MLAAAEAKPAPLPRTAAAPTPARSPPLRPLPRQPPAPTGERQTRRKMSPLRQKIAQRLVAAQHEAAMLTTFNEVDMSAVMALRAKYQDDFVKKNGVKLGFMSFFVKAVVHALKEVPGRQRPASTATPSSRINYYDIGMAVSTDKGLMVPVIRNCDTLGMADIEKADRRRRQARPATARSPSPTSKAASSPSPTAASSARCSPRRSSTRRRAPSSACTRSTSAPSRVNGQVVIRPMMYLALSYDHRLVDGKQAVTFLVKVKQAIEDPDAAHFRNLNFSIY